MKKFLSLMLAMIMVMSLVTVGAGAAFTDAADIEYTEAVELMAALKILEGPGDGTFNPKGNLTRGAAAKIIAYIALGAEEAAELTYGDTTFPDVPATSANAPYIAWCVENGIVDGYTDGNFGRKDYLTGYAFLKMVLNAIGEFGAYTGTGWKTVALVNAKNAGIVDDDLLEDITPSEFLTREQACQIAFNAMGVTRDAFTGYLVDGEKYETRAQALAVIKELGLDEEPRFVVVEGGTLLNAVHKVDTAATGVIVENSANADTKLTKLDNGKYYAVETGLDQLGNTVKIYFKKTTSYKDETGYTVFSVVDNCKEVAVTNSTKKDELKTALAAVGITGTAEKTFENVKVLKANGTVAETAVTVKVTPGTTTGKLLGVPANQPWTLIVSNKKIVGIKEQLDKELQKIGDIVTTADKATIKVGTSTVDNGYKRDDKLVDKINEYEGIAKNDIVVVTKIGAIWNVEKVETVTGKPTQIDGTKLTIGGVTYPQKGNGTAGLTKATSFDFSTEYTLYLDGQGNYIVAVAKTAPAATKTIVYFDGTSVEPLYSQNDKGALVPTNYATVVKTDGTIDAVKVADNFSKNAGMYEIQLDEDGEFYVFADAPADKVIAGDTTIAADAKKATITTNDKIYYYADDVKFIAIYTEDGELTTAVKTGVQQVGVVENITNTYFLATAVSGTDNYTVKTVLVLGKFDLVTETLEDIVYAIEESNVTAQIPYTDKNGEIAAGYKHTVYINGEKTTIITNSGDKMNGFFTLEKNGEGYKATPASSVTNVVTLITATPITNKYNNLITIAGLPADTDFTDAEVIDLRDLDEDETAVTAVSGLKKDMTIAVVVDLTGAEDVVAMVYVVDAI